MKKWLAVAALLLMSCGKPDLGPSEPTPLPTASPSPVPIEFRPTNGPLQVNAHRLLDRSGKKVFLLGTIRCCSSMENASTAKPDGWPLSNHESLLEDARHGSNYSHIRLGPNALNSPDRDGVAFLQSGNKLNLSQWNEAYWAKVRQVIEWAQGLGIYVEVSLIDGWILEHGYSPWLKDQNINGIDAGTCTDMQSSPKDIHNAWIRKVVEETGRYDNVLYLDGNELLKCDPVYQWSEGLKAIVRDEETRRGYSHHPLGTNSEVPSWRFLGYEVYHEEAAMPSHGRPLLINEYHSLSADEWREQVLAGIHVESSLMLWRGNMREAEWQKALGYLSEVRKQVGY